MSNKHKVINIIKLKDLDPVRAAYVHATLGQHPKKRNPDFVDTLIEHKLKKGKKCHSKKINTKY